MARLWIWQLWVPSVHATFPPFVREAASVLREPTTERLVNCKSMLSKEKKITLQHILQRAGYSWEAYPETMRRLPHFAHPHCWALSILPFKSCSSRTAFSCHGNPYGPPVMRTLQCSWRPSISPASGLSEMTLHWKFFDFLAKGLSISAEEFLTEQSWILELRCSPPVLSCKWLGLTSSMVPLVWLPRGIIITSQGSMPAAHHDPRWTSQPCHHGSNETKSYRLSNWCH